ncbi:dynein axonemal assembly factor 5 [Hypomesus transpacificus]|uniref:dynein axonemal assembly factor 5 n=1 Tax=Hypomesus transpacificus TaxID=137520 RepID=UPI001F07256E|nr:dynein axonemal assembly factor 5 [Hypomesus transpacificus]
MFRLQRQVLETSSLGSFRGYLEVFLGEALLPNLVWRAGRTAAAVRTSALSCLLALLQGGGRHPHTGPCSCLAWRRTPRWPGAWPAAPLSTLLALLGPSLHPDALHKVYPELLKRLDDSSVEVRAVALQALGVWLSCLGKDYNSQLCSPHLEFLFQQLLLHLDDPESRVQDAVLEVLKAGSSVHPALLKQEVEAVRDKQRSPAYCDQLLQHIQSLPRDEA